jgi:hypothetical protein
VHVEPGAPEFMAGIIGTISSFSTTSLGLALRVEKQDGGSKFPGCPFGWLHGQHRGALLFGIYFGLTADVAGQTSKSYSEHADQKVGEGGH